MKELKVSFHTQRGCVTSPTGHISTTDRQVYHLTRSASAPYCVPFLSGTCIPYHLCSCALPNGRKGMEYPITPSRSETDGWRSDYDQTIMTKTFRRTASSSVILKWILSTLKHKKILQEPVMAMTLCLMFLSKFYQDRKSSISSWLFLF